MSFFSLFYNKFLLRDNDSDSINSDSINKITLECYREMKIKPERPYSNKEIRDMYLDSGFKNSKLEKALKINNTRSASGILSVSLMLDGREMTSCKYNCYYCPNEPGQARSYLSNEGVPMLGASENYNTIYQTLRRLLILKSQGHPIDKMEMIILGGTWHSFPIKYRSEFILHMYYACNIFNTVCEIYNNEVNEFMKKPNTVKLSTLLINLSGIRQLTTLAEEKAFNTNAESARIISIVLETRPDEVCFVNGKPKHDNIMELREYGCTRIQVGVQSMDDNVLLCNNRGHTADHARKALTILLNYGFKIDIHIMPDLPGSTVESDKSTIAEIYTTTDYTFDQIKIYPCMDLPYTEIRNWHENYKLLRASNNLERISYLQNLMIKNPRQVPIKDRIWAPRSEYDFKALIDTLKFALEFTPSHVRINRLLRDFQKASDKNLRLGYESDNMFSDLRMLVESQQACYDIRKREVNNLHVDLSLADFIIKKFRAGNGVEYFISIEIPRNTNCNPQDTILLGLLRLRIFDDSSNDELIFHDSSAIIRELHVYGIMISNGQSDDSVQHHGLGKKLINKANEICIENNIKNLFVISGVGVMNYYKKLGFSNYHPGDYMHRIVHHQSLH